MVAARAVGEKQHMLQPRVSPPQAVPLRVQYYISSPSCGGMPVWKEPVLTLRSRDGSLTAAREPPAWTPEVRYTKLSSHCSSTALEPILYLETHFVLRISVGMGSVGMGVQAM